MRNTVSCLPLSQHFASTICLFFLLQCLLLSEQALVRPELNVQRFRGGLVFKAHRLCVSLHSRLGSNKEEEGKPLGVATEMVSQRTYTTSQDISPRVNFPVRQNRVKTKKLDL